MIHKFYGHLSLLTLLSNPSLSQRTFHLNFAPSLSSIASVNLCKAAWLVMQCNCSCTACAVVALSSCVPLSAGPSLQRKWVISRTKWAIVLQCRLPSDHFQNVGHYAAKCNASPNCDLSIKKTARCFAKLKHFFMKTLMKYLKIILTFKYAVVTNKICFSNNTVVYSIYF